MPCLRIKFHAICLILCIKMKVLICILAVACTVCHGFSNRVKRQTGSAFAYAFPANISEIIDNIDTGFDCQGLQFGYYADQNNNCQVYHICMPFVDQFGVERSRMWSFLCGLGTIFDQNKLVCESPAYATPCNEAANVYNVNDYFREENEERQFRDGLNNVF